MDASFDLPVKYKGGEEFFLAQLKQYGYTHRFVVDVYGQDIYFEPDEEGNYRALVDPDILEKNKKIEPALLQAIAAGIEAIVK